MAETILKVKNLKKKYKNNRGIDNVSFTIDKGDVFGLLGANGSGKTTTMKIITKLLRADHGEIELLPFKEVGSLIETPAFCGHLSAQKNLKIASRYYVEKQISSEEIDQILKAVGLLQYKNEPVFKFSLGMKQRMGLALAMVGNPKFYILDEPANGLDIEGMVEIRNIIIGLAKSNEVSFLISSHLSMEIQKMCNKVGIIHEGNLTEVAEMEMILENYPSLEDYYLEYIGRNGGASA